MKIGIYISDGMPMQTELLNKAINYLNDHGIEGYISDRSVLAHTPEAKVALFNEYMMDGTIDALMSFWGGLKSIEMLPYMNYDLIEKFKKPVIGYSDTTVLLQAIGIKTSCPTYHGPALITFAKPLYKNEAVKSLKAALSENKYILPIIKETNIQSDLSKDPIILNNERCYAYKKGESIGESIVGNLQTLLLLNGTEYEIKLNGKILFIEEAEEADENWFRRYLSQLTLMKDFKKLKGLVISKFTIMSNISDSKLISILNDYNLNNSNFPIIINCDSGHCDPIVTIPNYTKCHLRAIDKINISFEKII